MAMELPNIMITNQKFQLIVGVEEECTIELTNLGFDMVMYRMLTTARNRYFVKHTKGLLHPSTISKVTISLNRNHLLDGISPDTKILKDDFRVECAYVGENDVLEPNLQNIPQLLKDRKAADPQSVLRKMLRCHVLLDANGHEGDAAAGQQGAPETNAASTGHKAVQGSATAAAAASSLASGHKMTAQEMEVNTLLEQKKRKSDSSVGALSTSRIVIAIALVLAAIAVFMLTSFD